MQTKADHRSRRTLVRAAGRILTAIAFFVVGLVPTMFAQAPGVPASSNMRSAQYPRILPDHRVVFRVTAPKAHTVQMDLGKLYDLQRDSAGVWSVTTEPQGPGFHYYSLVIDSLAVADPASESYYGMGRMASGIEIPYTGEEYCALKDIPHGDIRQHVYLSPVTHTWRRLFVYTPPGYDASGATRYPCLYILHGGGEDERGWATQGKTDIILDNLIAEKKATPMIIVMPDGNMNLPGFGEEVLGSFEQELLRGVIPFVESRYRLQADAAHRALAGLSMGGLQTLYVGFRNTPTFSALGVFSSGWLPFQKALSDAQYAYIQDHLAMVKGNLKTLWISIGGKEDIAYQNCQIMRAKFDALGIPHVYQDTPGGHTWPVWRRDLAGFAPLLFKK